MQKYYFNKFFSSSDSFVFSPKTIYRAFTTVFPSFLLISSSLFTYVPWRFVWIFCHLLLAHERQHCKFSKTNKLTCENKIWKIEIKISFDRRVVQ